MHLASFDALASFIALSLLHGDAALTPLIEALKSAHDPLAAVAALERQLTSHLGCTCIQPKSRRAADKLVYYCCDAAGESRCGGACVYPCWTCAFKRRAGSYTLKCLHPLCGRLSPAVKNLLEHFVPGHLGYARPCDVYTGTYSTLTALNTHIKRMHSELVRDDIKESNPRHIYAPKRMAAKVLSGVPVVVEYPCQYDGCGRVLSAFAPLKDHVVGDHWGAVHVPCLNPVQATRRRHAWGAAAVRSALRRPLAPH